MTDEAATSDSMCPSPEMLETLRPEFRAAGQGVDGAYVDVLGKESAFGPHVGQKLFGSRALTLIYERLWRPGAIRLFLGREMRAARERRIVIDMLDLAPGNRVVDVGCGPGNYTRHLAKATGNGLAVGIDASAAMISRAARRQGGANVAYVRGDASAMPFVDGCFDAACCVGVLHLIENPTAALDEITRVLAPGGRLALLATCGEESSARARGGVTFFRRDELTTALRDRGFVDVEQRVVRRGQFVSARVPIR